MIHAFSAFMLAAAPLLQVSLVGHSAGAQLCMMALLQRAQAAHAAAAGSNGRQQPNPAPPQQQQQPTHLQMPQQFVGVTGVYDIAKHYAYEKDRGVHSLSTMLPAMGGFQAFAANSPSVILAAALQQQLQQHPAGQLPHEQQQQQQQSAGDVGVAEQEQQEPPACDFYNSFSLSGESIAHRIGGSCWGGPCSVGLRAAAVCSQHTWAVLACKPHSSRPCLGLCCQLVGGCSHFSDGQWQGKGQLQGSWRAYRQRGQTPVGSLLVHQTCSAVAAALCFVTLLTSIALLVRLCAGFDRGSGPYLSAEAGLHLQSLSGMAALPPFPLEAAGYLPPTVLMSSCTDLTVPW